MPFLLRAAALSTSDEVIASGMLRDALKDWSGVCTVQATRWSLAVPAAAATASAAGRTPPCFCPLAPWSPLLFLSARPVAAVVMPRAPLPDATDPVALVRSSRPTTETKRT